MKHVEEMKASRMGRQAVEVDYVWCIQQASRGLWIKDQMQQCHLDETLDLKGAESSECIRNKVYSIKPNTSVTLTLTKSEVTF